MKVLTTEQTIIYFFIYFLCVLLYLSVNSQNPGEQSNVSLDEVADITSEASPRPSPITDDLQESNKPPSPVSIGKKNHKIYTGTVV